MQVLFRAQGLEVGHAVRAGCEQRLAVAIGRLRSVARVVVHLRDVNGPRGGEDVLCLLVAHVDAQPTLVVRALAERAEDAVALASVKLAEALVRQTERVRRDRVAAVVLSSRRTARRSS